MQNNFGFYFSDIARLLRKRFDAAARSDGMTGAQSRVLAVIAQQPGINQGQLAERLDVEPITVCRMIDRMEQAGLVERRPDPHDRRARLLYPAAHAEELIAQLEAHARRLIAAMTENIGEEDRARLETLLNTIRANLLNDALFTAMEPANG
ncbi:MAG TPA: MarR family winged helix-turn-helix transcriptional regulator [Novosphingobium sp.]